MWGSVTLPTGRTLLQALVARCWGGWRLREGRLGLGPSPGCPLFGQGAGVRRSKALGAGVQTWGPGTGPLMACPSGHGALWWCQEVARGELLSP